MTGQHYRYTTAVRPYGLRTPGNLVHSLLVSGTDTAVRYRLLLRYTGRQRKPIVVINVQWQPHTSATESLFSPSPSAPFAIWLASNLGGVAS